MLQNSNINWDDLRLFLAIVRTGSARAAAAHAGVSHTTVKRRTEALERDLGCRLFDRDVSGYRLTGSGETLVSEAARAEEAVMAAERRLQGRDDLLSGRIVMTTTELIAHHLIMPDLVEFSVRYPEVDLNIQVSYDAYDLRRREADVALRFMEPGSKVPEELIGRKLGTCWTCYYATEAYLEAHDPSAKDSTARWIGWADEERYPEWVKASPYPDIPAYGSIESAVLQGKAAQQGMGMAALPCFMGDRIDGLVRLPGAEPHSNPDVWLLSHPDLRDTARFRAFRKFIANAIEAKRPLLEGRL